jgi:hypothetical protein
MENKNGVMTNGRTYAINRRVPLTNKILNPGILQPLKGIPETSDSTGSIELLIKLHIDNDDPIPCPIYNIRNP